PFVGLWPVVCWRMSGSTLASWSSAVKLWHHDFKHVAYGWPMAFMTRTNEIRTTSALTMPVSHHTLWAIFWASVREKGWPSIRPACGLSSQTRASSRRPPTSDGVLVAEFAEKTVSNHGNRV